ncbi:unnamed protein product [Cochlearia groenlandica]
MAKKMNLLSLFLISFLTLLSLSLQDQIITIKSPTRAHAELTSHGFPIGLLPLTIKDYVINKTSGEFSLFLDGSCKITLPPDNYLATYSNEVKGRIFPGQISDLRGIRVRAFFKWWSITGIRSSGENLVFEVGGVTAKYPSKNFDDTLDCEGKKRSSS